MLRREKKNGASAGVCEDGRIWTLFTPAPTNIISSDNGLNFDTTGLEEYCSSIAIDFAEEGISPPRKLVKSQMNEELGNIKINTEFLGAGVISFSCKPISKKLGPQLWYMFPNKKTKFQLPNERVFTLKDSDENLLVWINSLRSLNNLKALKLNKDLEKKSKKLIYSSVNHKRDLLYKIQKDLKQLDMEFIGENRFIGKNELDAAKHFWMSPTHRALLLNKHATDISILKKKHKGSEITVLSLAKNKKAL